MKTYDVYGIGNALVDTEYKVNERFLALQVDDHLTKALTLQQV